MDEVGVLSDRSFSEVLEGVRRVGVDVARRADELDQLGGFPKDLFDELSATGCFQAMLPRELGGLELSFSEINELIMAAAKANGSFGWIMLIGIPIPTIMSYFSPETGARLRADCPNPRIRGAIAPKGVAIPTEGGYLVSGRWPFASGGPDPDLIAGHCVVIENGAPRIGPGGVPDMVLAALPAAQVEFLDTWHVLGLRGTDSCDFAVHEVFVPEDMTTNIFTAKSWFDTPGARLPLRVVLAMGHASLAVGIAEGALDDIAELAKTKRAAMNPAALLAEDPVFRHSLGEHALRHASVRALLDQATERAWQAGLAGRPLSARETLEGRTMPGYVTAECVKIVDAAYTMAGSVSLYDASPLQRRLRDIHVATQHVAATGESYRTLGAVLVGAELSAMELF